MNKRPINFINDASDTVDKALAMMDLIYSAVMNDKEQEPVCVGADYTTDLLRKVRTDLANAATLLREEAK